MSSLFNPFRPNSPIPPGAFVGRIEEVVRLERALRDTRGGNAHHFMVTGERGIGKTSLLDYIRWVARGDIKADFNADGDEFRFVAADIEIEKNTTPASLVRKINRSLEKQLGGVEAGLTFLKKTREFVSRLETSIVKIGQSSVAQTDEDILDELAYSLTSTVGRMTEEDGLFGKRYDGIVIFIDEADSASPSLDLGALLKLLTERLHKRGCAKLCFGLAGLPELREKLRCSHASVLRVLDEVPLERLTSQEAGQVIDRCLEVAREEGKQSPAIADDARSLLIRMSEGYPHFVHQFGYSACDVDRDGVVSGEDVLSGGFNPRGAIEIIGDKYYRDDYYNKIKKDSYREVLSIMAEKLDQWISKEEIRQKFKGKASTLSHALHALRARRIILVKEGEKGIYRLGRKAFALWIRLHRRGSVGVSTGDSAPTDTRSSDG